VQGEISNLSRPASGHLYFTLKDAGASLRIVMWKSDALRSRVPLQDGMEIEVHGYISLYEVQGQYQLYADEIRLTGEGKLYQEFMRLKAQLEAEGLFAVERKRPIPDLPHAIGVVTSETGAALRDMLDTLQRRLPKVEVVLAASQVQGAEAPPALVAALQSLDRLGLDVILLARGGGSMEDLWPFNDERLVRAVASTMTPVISGVGHETDFTLCDFVADLRAPTPTAAAELATPITMIDLRASLDAARNRLANSTLIRLTEARHILEIRSSQLLAGSPYRRIQTGRQRLDDLARRAASALQHGFAMNRSLVTGFDRRLLALNPLSVLARGFAIVTNHQDRLVSSVKQVKSGDALEVQVSDGSFGVEVSKSKES